MSLNDKMVRAVLAETGIHTEELQYKPIGKFEARAKMNDVVYSAASIKKLRYERTEQLRQKHVGQVLAGLRKLQAEGPAAADDGPIGGETAIKMMEEQVAQLLAQEKKKAAEIAKSRAERAKLDQAVEEEAERLRQANAVKQAQILKDFEEKKAAFEETVRLRKEAAQAARQKRAVKKQEEFEANVEYGRKQETERVERDKVIEAAQKVRLEEMQKRAKVFAKKCAAKISRIAEDRAEAQRNADRVADEKERLVLEKAAKVAARAEEKQQAVMKANRKKQREIARRLVAKNAEDKAIEDQRDAEFEEKMKTVDTRLERSTQETKLEIAGRIAARKAAIKKREERMATSKYQRETAGASGLDKAQMKGLICQQAFERKKDKCLTRAVENQMRYQARLMYIAQQQRIEAARVARMTEQSELKSTRSQSVIDAKLKMRDLTKEKAKLAGVARARLSNKAKIPPLAWMLDPLMFENQAQGKSAAAACRRHTFENFNVAAGTGLPPLAASSLGIL